MQRILGCLVSMMMFAVPMMAQTGRTEVFQGRDVMSGEIIVRFRPAARGQVQAAPPQDLDIASSQPVGQTGMMLLKSRGRDVRELLQAYAGRADVQYAEPNYVWHTTDVPNDPDFGLQYGLENTGQVISGQAGLAGADIKAVPAWGITQGSQSVVVGVVDTGVAYNHPDLAANIWSAPTAFSVTISGQTITCPAGSHGFNAILRNCDPLDDNMHGTHVSGIIGASGNNGLGVSGVNRVASIMGLKFLSAGGSGSTVDAVAAIEFAVQVKAIFGAAANIRVLNNSWGGGGASQTLLDAINLANANDMLFLAAAGNSASNNDTTENYPSNYNAPNIIAIAATDNRDSLASFSSYGATTVHLGAPGVSVYSTFPPNTYRYLSGTSMATPMAAGAAALVLSACNLTTAALKTNLINNVDAVPALLGKTITGGRLNVYQSLTHCSGTPLPEFTVSLTPPVRNVATNQTATFDLVVAPANGFTGTVSLTATGLPSGMTAAFSPSSISGGAGASTLSLTTVGVPAGAYLITITGTSGSVTRTRFVSVTVGPPSITSIKPVSGVAGMTINAVVQGIGLDNGASAIAFNGTGITGTVGSGTPFGGLPVTLAIDANAPAGTQSFTVTTATGVSAPFTGFTVIVPQAISPGQTISGSLTNADPIDPLFPGYYADYYKLTLNAPTQVAIDMRSSSFAAWIGLVSSSGSLLSYSGSANPQIATTLAAGTYYIDASSGTQLATGAYTLSINVLPAITAIAPPFATQGSVVDVTFTGNRFAAPVTVDAGNGITVSNPVVASPQSLTATFTIAAGATADVHSVTVTTADGASNVKGFSVFPSIPSIGLGETISGALATTDGHNPYFTPSYADLYKLTIGATTPVIIDLKSDVFDTTLRVLVDSGAALLYDNNGGGGTNSRIFTTLAPGTYYLDVSSVFSSTTGAYSISVNVLPAITSIVPNWGAVGSSVAVTLNGQRFTAPLTVNAGSGITVSNIILSGSTSATATFAIAASATVGDRSVTVTTPDGTSNGAVFSVVNQPAPSLTTWKTTGSMTIPRRDHTATLLADGRVLIVGWTTTMVEAFDPVTETFTPVGNTLCIHTQGSTATRLPDGKVLIMGGSGDLLCAEIYDPATGRFSLTGTPLGIHNYQSATLLPNGKVLIAGGHSYTTQQTQAIAELYDPATGSFALTGSLNDDRSGHMAALLQNGKVLIAGGFETTTPGNASCLKSAELYDPASGTFSKTADTAAARCVRPESVVLSTGKVLIAGDQFNPPELFDPASGTFSAAGSMAVPRFYPAASLLSDGKALFVGGFISGPGTSVMSGAADVYDPAAGAFSATSSMGMGRVEHTATLLMNGKVLVAGGWGGTSELSFAELYTDAPPNSPISPIAGQQGLSVNVTLVGNNFLSPMTVNAGAGISVSNVSVVNSHQATATFAIAAGAAPGARSVTVTTSAGASGAVTFTILPPAPTLTSISPASGAVGTNVAVALSGTNFFSGMTVDAGSNIAAGNVVVVSATTATATFVIGSGAALGARGVTVSTVTGTSGSVTFTVGASMVPTLTGISPSSGGQTVNVNVTLTGTNFGAGMTIDAGSNITVSSINVVSGTSATAAFAIGAGAALGARNVTVTTSGGTSGAATFTVLVPPPTLVSVNPASGAQGASVGVTLTGTNFVAGMTVDAGNNITASNVAVASATSATATLAIGGATLGARNLKVSTPSGASGSVTFTVLTPPPPTLSSVSPAIGGQGSTFGVTLTGTNFVQGMTLDAGSNITANSVIVASGTSATAAITIASGAALGARNLTVATEGGTSGAVTFTVLPPPPVLTTWITTGSMNLPRRDHTSTLLANGKVLIVGGVNAMAELYDPAAETFTSLGNTLCQHGPGATATRLPSGKVLLVGGGGDQLCAELYDPAAGSFSLTGSPNAAHNYFSATLLANGKVLIAAGQTYTAVQTIAIAELYDPATGSFTLTGSLNDHRSAHSATLLPNGKVLIAGGLQTTTPGNGICLNSAELYDPAAGTFSKTGNMAAARCSLYWSDSPVLSTGKVLIAGGLTLFPPELFDPATGTFSTTGSMTVPRRVASVSLLPSGKVLVAGGADETVFSSAELYDPASGTFTPTSAMGTARVQHGATVLADGRVLVTGGDTGATYLRSAELYTEASSNSAITPVSGQQTLSVNVTLVGNNFLSPMTIDAGAGITVSNISVVSAHQATATFAISNSAALGARGVTVTTSGGTSAAVTFSVLPPPSAPVISDLSAATSGLSQAVAPYYGSPFTLTLNGQTFESGAVVSVGGVNLSTTFVSATQLTAQVTTAVLSSLGAKDVKVTNPIGLSSNAVTLNVVARGDINASGAISIGDALVCALTTGGINKPALPVSVGDVNLSGAANIGDCLALALFAGRINANLTTPAVTSFLPGPAVVGAPLGIAGTGFGGAASDLRVLFTTASGVTRVAPQSASATSLSVAIPNNAISGPIQVYRMDAPMGGNEYPLDLGGSTIPLTLMTASPFFNVARGSSVTLTGMGFGSPPASNTVLFGTTPAVVTAAGPASLTVTVPANAVCGPVTVGAAQTSEGRIVTISGTTCGVQLADILGNASPGETMTLEGVGFNVVVPANNIVTFAAAGGTVTGTVLQAGGTQLQVRVPATAVQGALTVTVGGTTSNTLQYSPPF